VPLGSTVDCWKLTYTFAAYALLALQHVYRARNERAREFLQRDHRRAAGGLGPRLAASLRPRLASYSTDWLTTRRWEYTVLDNQSVE
jgi:hypothetical protein